MKRMLELNVGAMILLTFAVGCGGSSTESGSGGASSSAGSSNGGAAGSTAMPGGGSTAMPGGGAHSGGQPSTPGGGGPPAGGGFMTSVPGTTPLKELTPDQKTQLCSDLQTYVTSSVVAPLADFECKTFALIAASQATSDAEAQSACAASLAQCTPDTTTGTGMCDATVAATCTATVADATTCINDQSALIASLDASVPNCTGITAAKALAALSAVSGNSNDLNPPSCAKYNTQCPGSMTGMQ